MDHQGLLCGAAEAKIAHTFIVSCTLGRWFIPSNNDMANAYGALESWTEPVE